MWAPKRRGSNDDYLSTRKPVTSDGDIAGIVPTTRSGKWCRAVTEEGNPYYYHSGTGAVQWTPPLDDSGKRVVEEPFPAREMSGVIEALESGILRLEKNVRSINDEISGMKRAVASLRDAVDSRST